jgi:hypothetical protein
MTPDLLSTTAIESKIIEINSLILHMERMGYGHLATTIRADIYVLNKELLKRKK